MLALAALWLLHERPMHPYEMSRVLFQERRVDQTLGVKRGSLYHAVERLESDGLIEAIETSREGRRPERTVYRVTEAGTDVFAERLRDLLTDVVREPTRLTAGLQFLTSLAPEEARELLESRLVGLRALVASFDALLRLEWPGATRIQALETEHDRAVVDAELRWVEGVVDDLRSGRLTWSPNQSTAPGPTLELIDGKETG